MTGRTRREERDEERKEQVASHGTGSCDAVRLRTGIRQGARRREGKEGVMLECFLFVEMIQNFAIKRKFVGPS